MYLSTCFRKFSVTHMQKYAAIITYNRHILECFPSFDWLVIFYYIYLILTLQYSTIFEGLINPSKIVLGYSRQPFGLH